MKQNGSWQAGDDLEVTPFEFINPIDWQDQSVPERRWLLPNWIPLRATTLLSGDGGIGKSSLALQLAAACATGGDFLDMAVMHCKVVYVSCEDEADELQRRLVAIATAFHLDLADLENLRLVTRVGLENVLLQFENDRQKKTVIYDQLMRIRDFGAQLLVLDTAADFYGGNENLRPQVRAFITLLTSIALDIDGAVLLLSHPSLTGRSSGTGESGSTGWNNAVRSRLYLSLPKVNGSEPSDHDARVLSCQKANYARTGNPIALRYDEGVFVRHGKPADGAADEDQWTRERREAADQAFLAGLEELSSKHIDCNIHRGQANYGPRSLVEMTNAAKGFAVVELESAMRRLIKRGKIESIKEGPGSRRRSHIRVIAPDLPLGQDFSTT